MTARKVARREFLKTGSAAAIGLTAAVLGPDSLFAAGRRRGVPHPLLGVGYAPSAPAAGESVRLEAAGRTLVGDPGFISHGARVTIGSFSRAARYQGLPGGSGIDVIHPAIGYAPEKYPRFRAWSFSNEDNMDSVSGAIGFTVPVIATQGLQFLIRPVNPEIDSPVLEERLALTLGSESGALKLQRGVYVIAFRESGSDSVPPWSAHSLREKSGQLVVDTDAFTYAVVTIDYER